MRNHSLLLLPLALVILSAGCVTDRNSGVIVSARRDARFSPTPADKICMALRPNPNAEDAALGAALLAELARENFNIVTNVEADYWLAYLVEDDSTEQTYQHQEVILAPPPQTTRDIVVQGLTNQRQGEFNGVNESIIVPTTLVFQKKGIRLYLYANPKTHPGGLQIAWEGCIEAGKTIPAGREPVLIKTLLGYFGQDYVGRVTPP